MSSMRWSEPSLPEDGGIGTTPTIKNHSVTFYRGLLYCFGGYDGRRNNQTLLIYSLREGKWIAPSDPSVNSSAVKNSARHEQFEQYNVPPGRNGHTATLATSRRSRRNNNHFNFNADNLQQQQQQQQPDDVRNEHAAAAMNEDDPQAADYDGGGENMQGGDAVLPINGENSMDTDDDDDDDEDAQIFIIGGWLGSG